MFLGGCGDKGKTMEHCGTTWHADARAFRRAALLCILALLIALGPRPARAAHDGSERSEGPATSFRGLSPPREPPFFEVRDADGRVLGLDAFRGKVMLLNLWATWCIPCVREMPALDRLQGKFDKADFVVVPLSLDKQGLSKVEPFYKRHELQNLDIYLDPELKIEQGFPVDVLPANFLFDRQGRVAGYVQNYVDWDAPEAEAMVRGLVENGTIGE